MNRLKWLGLFLAAASFLLLGTTGTFSAQEKKPEKHDGSLLRESLRDVINFGADLFNKYGDHAGCYRLYQGSLLSIKPFLPPATQKEIDMALAEAEKLPRYSERAFALRKTIDNIRVMAGGAPPEVMDKNKRGENKSKEK